MVSDLHTHVHMGAHTSTHSHMNTPTPTKTKAARRPRLSQAHAKKAGITSPRAPAHGPELTAAKHHRGTPSQQPSSLPLCSTQNTHLYSTLAVSPFSSSAHDHTPFLSPAAGMPSLALQSPSGRVLALPLDFLGMAGLGWWL